MAACPWTAYAVGQGFYYKKAEKENKAKEKEVDSLIEDGFQEITLLGQNVNAYGKDLDDNTTFSMLLEETAKIGIERIRFVTSHPWDFTDEMIDIIANNDNIMPYIHLPLQSGSSRILKLMGRRYTKESYLELFHKIKDKVKNAVFKTDLSGIDVVTSGPIKSYVLYAFDSSYYEYNTVDQKRPEIKSNYLMTSGEISNQNTTEFSFNIDKTTLLGQIKPIDNFDMYCCYIIISDKYFFIM